MRGEEAEVRRCPSNAQCRLDLAHALEATEPRRALAEARHATRLVPTYGRAWRTVRRLEEKLGPLTDDDASYLIQVEDVEEFTQINDPERCKARGNELFAKRDFWGAEEEYTRAIDALRPATDAKIFSNRAAVYLNTKRYVRAASDAQSAVEADAAWWKGHFYKGQALLALVKQSRRRCSANAERAQEASRAFEAALKIAPASKIQEISTAKDVAQSQIYAMACPVS